MDNINGLIKLMKKYTILKIDKEIGEQDATEPTPEGGTTGGGGKNNPTTWSGTVGANLKRGKANPLGNTKWESGLTRGPANQLL